MAEAHSPAKLRQEKTAQARPLSSRLGVDAAAGISTFLFIALFSILSIQQQKPPAAAPAASTSPLEFSSGRAVAQLANISQTPHPIGSTEHQAVRDYLSNELEKLGLHAEVQKAVAVRESTDGPFHVGSVENIVGRLSGTGGSGRAIVLVGHYDTVPTSRGASDDGSAIVTILETMRAIKAGPPLKNDVICLFTDGEEVGLMGARAFVAEHPWARDAALVLNFEARGNGGPSFMFETSEGNGWLIEKFADSAPHPMTNSLLYEIYKHLPNDSDLTIFKRAGYAGLNFAYIEGFPYYHTFADSLDQLEQPSLQHQGSYALALTRRFGNVDLTNPKAENAVYFDLLGRYLIHYSYRWVVPLSIAVLLLFIGTLAFGLRRKQLTLRGIGLGFLALLASMTGVFLLVELVWFNIKSLHSGYRLILQGTTYNSDIYVISLVALAVAVTTSFYLWFRTKTNGLNLFAGGLLCWALLLLMSSFYLPGASYLFALPLFFSLLSLIFLLKIKDEGRLTPGRLAVLCLCAVPGLLLLVPVIHLLFVALPSDLYAVVVLMVVLVLGLLIPHLKLMALSNKWLLPGVSVLVCLVFILVGTATSGFNNSRPKPDNIFYAMNADTGKAVWGSTDERTDEWTSQFFNDGLKRGALSEYVLSDYDGFMSSPAPLATLAGPSVEILSDNVNDGMRNLRLRITSQRAAPFMSVEVESATEIVSAEVEGKRLEHNETSAQPAQGESWQLFYYAPPREGVEVALSFKPSSPLKLRVLDQSFTLPQSVMSFRPRPASVMSTPYPFNPFGDATIVSKRFSL
jgi:MprA protease rhombosortase-interaction domain-containing protein